MRSRYLLTLWLGTLLLAPVYGQRLSDGSVALEKKAILTNSLRRQLIKAEIKADPKDQGHVEAIGIAAKEMIYPLAWMTTSGRPPAGKVNAQVTQFDSAMLTLSSPKYRENTQETQQIFIRQAIAAAQEVMQSESSKPIASMNAARLLSRIPVRRVERGEILESEKDWLEAVLPRLAEGNGELLANTCLQELENPRANDGTRYYLLQTLASLLAIPPQQTPLLKPETVEKALLIATQLVEQPVPFPKATPRQEVEGYKKLRLQGVLVLAQARAPIVGKQRVALTLAKVAGNDARIEPAPRYEERLEAAIGLARMGRVAAKFPEFQTDYAAYLIAQAAAAFGEEANANREAREQERLAPWAVQAARFLEAVEGLKFHVKTPYVQQVCDQTVKLVLANVERKNSSDYGGLNDWLGLNPPPANTLFRGDAASAIQTTREPPAKDEETEPKKTPPTKAKSDPKKGK